DSGNEREHAGHPTAATRKTNVSSLLKFSVATEPFYVEDLDGSARMSNCRAGSQEQDCCLVRPALSVFPQSVSLPSQRYKYPATAAPAIGTIQNIQSCARAQP